MSRCMASTFTAATYERHIGKRDKNSLHVNGGRVSYVEDY